MRRIVAAATASAVALLAPVAAGAAPTPVAAGGIGIRVVDVPVDELHNPRALSYIIDHVKPGETISRHVEVSNTTDSAQHVTLYAGGATISDDSFVPGADDELSGWTKVAPGVEDLATGAKARPLVTIRVPKDVASGERYAAVWAEVKSSGPGQVAQINRVGIRIYLDVSGGKAPESAFTVSAPIVSGTAQHARISASVDNTGGRAVDVSGKLTLSSADRSITAGPFSVDKTVTLRPGESGPARVTVPRPLPAGRWHVSLQLQSGTIVHTTTGDITLAAAEARADAPAPTKKSGPSTTLAVIASILGWAGRGRRPRRVPAAATEARVMIRMAALAFVLLTGVLLAAPAGLAAPAPSGSSDGNVVFTVTGSPHVPPSSPGGGSSGASGSGSGSHGGASASAPAAPSSSSGGGTGGTASTGAAIALYVSTGVLLVAAGAGLVAAGRHRGRRAT